MLMLTSIRFGTEIDEEKDEPSRSSWRPMGMLFFGLFLFIPLGYALHQCGLDWGARFYAPSAVIRLMGGLVLTLIIVQMVAVWPLTAFVYPEVVERRRMGFGGFLLASLVLFTPPLSAFVCYFGDVKELMDGYEVFLIVFPALVIALVSFWRTQSAGGMVVFLSLALFVPLYLLNDLLSPFPVLIAYASKGPAFYWWRSLFPIATTALALASVEKTRFTVRNFRRELAFIVLAMMASVVVLRIAIPLAVARHEGLAWNAYVEWDGSWFLYFPMLFFVFRPSRIRYGMMLAASVLGALSYSGHLLVRPWRGALDFWRISSFSQELIIALLLWQVAWLLWKPQIRFLFLTTARNQTQPA